MAGKLDSALKSLRRAVEILERLDRQYPGVLNYQGGLASTYNMMSDSTAVGASRPRRWPSPRRPGPCSIGWSPSTPRTSTRASTWPRLTTTSAGCTSSRASRPRPCGRSSAPSTCYESLPEPRPRNSYNLACNLALGIPLIGAENGTQGTLDADKLSKGDRFRRREVRRPGDRGPPPRHRGGFLNPEILRSDTDLDAIRGRADFQDLIKEVDQVDAGAK